MKSIFLSFFLICGTVSLLLATHNKAGIITYRQTDDRTIIASIITWTEPSSQADRDTLVLCWGDGNCDRVARSNGEGEILDHAYQLNYYTATHTYADSGSYTLSMVDPNRNPTILNVDFPNSASVRFAVETHFVLLDLEEGAENNMPEIEVPPINIAFVGQAFSYTPAAYDREGDSLAYELVTPLQDVGLAVPNYQPLTEIVSGPNNQLSFDPHSGLLLWKAPQLAGAYTVALLVKSYRDGREISRAYLDMLISVMAIDNTPPDLTLNPAIGNFATVCVNVGDTVDVHLLVSDPDTGQLVDLKLFSEFNAFLAQPEGFSYDPAVSMGAFHWIVREEQRRSRPYQAIFRAVDILGAATYRVMEIVVADCEDFAATQRISGNVFWDDDEDGLWDEEELPLPGRQLVLSPVDLSTFTDEQGRYTFYVAPGAYELAILPDDCWALTTDSATYTVEVALAETQTRDFGFKLVEAGISRYEASLVSSPTRCDRGSTFWMSVQNTGCARRKGWVALVYDDRFSLPTIDIDPWPDVFRGDTLWWAFDTIPPLSSLSWQLEFRILPPEVIGMTLDFEVLVFTEGCPVVEGFNGPWEGELGLCDHYHYTPIILCSYDPNDKLVQPARGEDANYTLFDEELEYTIRFQNTGNDTAFVVVIRDTLDANLDWTTFRPFSASHPYEVLKNDGNGVLLFRFQDINLVDSTTNEADSHGFVTYKIRPRTGLAVNTIIENRAGIYFDGNAPILTNTTRNTLVDSLITTEAVDRPLRERLTLAAYPNPFTDFIQFDMEGHQPGTVFLEIIDLGGRIVYREVATAVAKQHQWRVSGQRLPVAKGVLIYRISTRNGTYVGMIVRA